MRRIVTVLAALVAALLVGLSIVAFVTVRRSFPDTTGEVRLNGLNGTIEIKRDGHGIPQIYADDPADLFFAQGYVQAQDRFYEMDFRRHVTAGRLSELVGEAGLDTDEFVRTLGWRRVAQQEYAELDMGTRTLLQAYSRGVNAYVDGKSGSRLALEYAVLSLTRPDYRPEPWTPVDSVAWVKAMAWDLRSNMTDEIDRAMASRQMPVDRVEKLYPDPPSKHRPIVTNPELDVRDGRFGPPARVDQAAFASLRKARDAGEALPALLGTGGGIGSNSWVVDGGRSATGKPILANDPHLSPSMPGIWYQVGLHCRELTETCPYDVAGFSFSGMPGVVVGHNRRIAWGVSTMYADVTDLYLERVTDDTYEYKGKQLPLTTRRERIKVADGKTRTITVRSTRHGPLLSDVSEEVADVGGGTTEVALQWTALTPRPTISAVFALDRAKNWKDFRAAARRFTVPSQNLVYADVDGNIGYQAPGAIPIRSRGDGRWPVPGWDGKHERTGYVPFRELPSELNPDDGFIVTANNQVIGDRYPHVLGKDTAPGYRSERIRELLTSKKRLSVGDMSRFQLDTHSANAERLVPYLLDTPLDTRFARQGQDMLRGWDFRQIAESGAAAYFSVVWRNLLELTFHDELPRDQWPDGGERWFNVLSTIIDKPNSRWWDNLATPTIVERRDDVLRDAMVRARDEMTRIQSRDPDGWEWGHLHRLTLVNPTLGDSGVGLVNRVFNRGPVRVGGGGGLVNANAWDAAEGYEVTAVPSMRMVVDLANPDRSRWIQLSGTSGHAYHPHYADQLPLWAEGRTLPWVFGTKAVQRSTEDTLTLRPTTQ
ncbi:MAG: penicillin acylase family protein [Aeromicrobium sp.]